jgi:D-arabinose 1-dehydrogenase-like Zn-dependent alcohol dehydrogenase
LKAAVLTKYGSLLEIKEVLVKMIACGICHTDLDGAREGK